MTQWSPNDFDRFRGWALTALYASMALLSTMLLYALYRLKHTFEELDIHIIATAISCAAAALFSALAALRYYRNIRGGTVPPLALKPFLFMALALAFAGRLFNGL